MSFIDSVACPLNCIVFWRGTRRVHGMDTRASRTHSHSLPQSFSLPFVCVHVCACIYKYIHVCMYLYIFDVYLTYIWVYLLVCIRIHNNVYIFCIKRKLYISMYINCYCAYMIYIFIYLFLPCPPPCPFPFS